MNKLESLSQQSENDQSTSIDIPGFPEVSTQLLTNSPDDLQALRDLQARNADFFMLKGGISIGDFAKVLENGNPEGARFYGAWTNGELIASVVMAPYSEQQVEIGGAVDMKHTRQGLAYAAAQALIEHENDNGFDVIAEVEHRNEPNVEPLLNKLGFIKEYATHDGRSVYTHMSEEGMIRRLYGM